MKVALQGDSFRMRLSKLNLLNEFTLKPMATYT